MKNALEESRWLLWLGLQRQTVDARERVRDVLGAVLGLWVAGGLTWLGWGATSPWLAATMGASAVLLFAVALAWRRLTRPVPVHAPVVHGNRHSTADPAPQDRVGLTTADLDAALRDFNQLVDIDRNSLEELLRQAQMQAWQRRFGSVCCADIMSRDLVTVEFSTPLAEAWSLLHRHRIRALPVVDRARRVIGVVTMVDFIKHAQLDPRQHISFGRRIRQLLTPTPGDYSDKAEVVGQTMSSPVQTAGEHESVVELVPRLSDQGLHQVPVVDGERRLSGMVTQADLVAALYRSQFSGAASSR